MKIWRPYTQESTAEAPLKVASAEGAYLHLADGRRLFDGISSWWLTTHGHGRREIVEAVTEQSRKLAQIVFANFTHEAAERVCNSLATFLPKTLSRMFFSDNGSTAVEVAMKMAYQYFHQRGESRRKRFLTFDRAYHGDTCGAMSVSRNGEFTENYRGLLFDVIRCKQGVSIADPISTWTSDVIAALEKYGDETCAVILEPLLQGAGGMIVWPSEAVKRICAEARRRGVLVIFDEVMTGFGRTGSMFAFEQVGFTPDFICLSKGLTAGFLPMGLTITSEAVYEGFLSESPGRMFFHGHSFTGNALSSAAAAANLEIWKREPVVQNLARIQHAQTATLERIRGRLPVHETRVCGTVGVAELEIRTSYGGSFSRNLYSACLKRNLYLRTLGSTVYLMPTYCTTNDEITWAWETIADAVAEVLS